MTRTNAADDQAAEQAGAAARRSAADRIQGVVVLAAPYAQQAAGRFGPFARTAGQRGVRSAQVAFQAVGPRLDDAYVRLTPVVVAARGRVNDEVLPRVSGAWVAASGSPVVLEVSKRGRAALAAARGELSLPEVASAKPRSWPKRLAVFAGAAGVGVVAARKLLAAKGVGQGTHATTAPAADSAPAPGPSSPATGSPVQATGTESASGRAATLTGTGIYVGSEPPAGFTIKGDESTLTYRTVQPGDTEGSTGDVWFGSEDTARRAGFSAAQD